ncbi:hypothetical protein ACN082_09720 [Rothia sp. CCM 9417]|uniref:hypothetical protein n=1 Tax=Rothia sp. CCM 9417 TaxID=3402657 RepID=UPI003AEB8756
MRIAQPPLVLLAFGAVDEKLALVRATPPLAPIVSYRRNRYSTDVTCLHLKPDGNLLVGFGDWSLNGGKVPILEVDSKTGEVRSQSEPLRTENISIIKDTSGGLVVPYTDPTANTHEDTPAGRKWRIFARQKPDGSWEESGDFKQAIHAFDAVELDGELFFCGSIYPGYAAIFTPGGNTTAGKIVASEQEQGDYHRFYRFYPHTEKSVRVYNPGTGRAYIFDGNDLTPDETGWAPSNGALYCPSTGYQLFIGPLNWRIYTPEGVLFWDAPAPVSHIPTAFTCAPAGKTLWVGHKDGSLSCYYMERR